MIRRLSLLVLLATLAVALTPALSGLDSAPGTRSTTPTNAADEASIRRAAGRHLGAHRRDLRHQARDVDPGRGTLAFGEPRNFATLADPPTAGSSHQGDDAGAPRVPVTDSVAVGNFDEDPDGHLDVVQTNVLAGSISVFRGNGRGGFATPTVTDVGTNPGLVVARDLDGDSHLDLVIVDPGTTNAGVSAAKDSAVITMRGDGQGGFTVTNTVSVTPPPRNLALGDVNHDGVTDVAVASRGAFSAFAQLPSAGGVVIFTGTIDRAGAYALDEAQTIRLTKDNVPVGANAVALGNFDGQGGDDLAVAIGTSVKSGDRAALGSEPDGDDLLVFLNGNVEGGDAFGQSPSQRFRVGALPEAIAAADWNDDGYVDLAVLNAASGEVTSFTNDGEGRFTPRASNASVGAMPRSLEVADVDTDGFVDLVTATYYSSTVSVLRGRGDGSFEPAVDFWAGDEPTSVKVGLFDDDKRPDIVAGRLQTDELALLINDSPRPDDGVVAVRGIPYVDVADDPMAAHHTLDVWKPAPGTPSFTGPGKAYPVVVFGHGGSGIAGDKSAVANMMRSLARVGIVAVSTDYRLDGTAHYADTQTDDYAAAVAWVHAHIGAARFGGDPDKIVAAGTSTGAALAVRVAMSSPTHARERGYIDGVFVAGAAPQNAADAAASVGTPLPSLAVGGDQDGEGPTGANGQSASNFVAAAKARGGDAELVIVAGHDHFEVGANLARDDDAGRAAVLRFLRKVWR